MLLPTSSPHFCFPPPLPTRCLKDNDQAPGQLLPPASQHHKQLHRELEPTPVPNPRRCPNKPNSDSLQTFSRFGDLCLPTQLGKNPKASMIQGPSKETTGLKWGGDWVWEDRTEHVPEGLLKGFYHLFSFFLIKNKTKHENSKCTKIRGLNSYTSFRTTLKLLLRLQIPDTVWA